MQGKYIGLHNETDHPKHQTINTVETHQISVNRCHSSDNQLQEAEFCPAVTLLRDCAEGHSKPFWQAYVLMRHPGKVSLPVHPLL